MIPYDKIFGRLGNQMFQGAFLSAMAKEMGTDRYFQDPKWFDEAESDIKYFYHQGIEQIDMVAIHIRRGDYVNHPLYVDLSKTDYYDKAIKHFTDEDFIVFSDDIAWAKEYFDGMSNVEFCEEADPVKAMNIMAGCLGIICANSSFSWWAAYLSSAKKIVAPSEKNWYNDGNKGIPCPKSWIRI